MTKEEIALQLTLKAMEHDKVGLLTTAVSDKKSREETREFNAKQLYEFYNDILENIKGRNS